MNDIAEGLRSNKFLCFLIIEELKHLFIKAKVIPTKKVICNIPQFVSKETFSLLINEI